MSSNANFDIGVKMGELVGYVDLLKHRLQQAEAEAERERKRCDSLIETLSRLAGVSSQRVGETVRRDDGNSTEMKDAKAHQGNTSGVASDQSKRPAGLDVPAGDPVDQRR